MKTIKNSVKLHMNQLCNEIGARPTGSAANQAAVRYAAAEFVKLGFDVTLQRFDCIDWQNHGTTLSVEGVPIEAEAAEYSLPCDVTAELVFADSVETLRRLDMNQKICVLYGELCKEPLMPKSFTFWNPEEHQEIIRLLECGAPLAVITVSFLADTAVPIIQDGDFNIPCAAVRGSCLELLLAGQVASLRLATERVPSYGENVVAEYGKGAKKVSFSAHIDTKPGTPGALDNAGGVAALLALAEQAAGTDYPYRLEFVLFNGEDYYSTPGETLYTATYLQHPEEYVCAFNVDGIGMMNSKTSYSFYECPPEMQQRLEAFALNFTEFEMIAPWPMGDHMLFAGSGIPAVAVTASEIFTLMDSVMHTPADNLSIVDYDKIAEAVAFLHGAV